MDIFRRGQFQIVLSIGAKNMEDIGGIRRETVNPLSLEFLRPGDLVELEEAVFVPGMVIDRISEVPIGLSRQRIDRCPVKAVGGDIDRRAEFHPVTNDPRRNNEPSGQQDFAKSFPSSDDHHPDDEGENKHLGGGPRENQEAKEDASCPPPLSKDRQHDAQQEAKRKGVREGIDIIRHEVGHHGHAE